MPSNSTSDRSLTIHCEPVSIAVVTHAGSFVNISDFLKQIKPAIENYPGICELIVINNSGLHASQSTKTILERFSIKQCTIRVLASPQNNIATARKIAVESTSYKLLVFIDDDEFPVPFWLTELIAAKNKYGADMVAGPTYPLYLFDTANWIKTVDLHNARDKKTGQSINKAGAGNLLIDTSKIIGDLFDETYGRSGGEDTEFVIRQVKAGLKLVWTNEAAAYEYMPKHKSTSRYFIKRFVLQGQLHRKVLSEAGLIRYQCMFSIKSVILIALSCVVAPCFLLLSNNSAGNWIKRGFANVGHLTKIEKRLYSNVKSPHDP